MIAGDWTNWAIVFAAGAVTLAARASFIMLPPGVRVPALLTRCLRYVAAAVLPALVVPEVLFRDLPPDAALNVARIAAALVATIVALTTRSVFATLGGGMAALWLLKWWGPF